MARRPNDQPGRRAKMTSKGQVTVPKAIRDQLGLHAGVSLHFWVDPTGRIVVTPLTRRTRGSDRHSAKTRATADD